VKPLSPLQASQVLRREGRQANLIFFLAPSEERTSRRARYQVSRPCFLPSSSLLAPLLAPKMAPMIVFRHSFRPCRVTFPFLLKVPLDFLLEALDRLDIVSCSLPTSVSPRSMRHTLPPLTATFQSKRTAHRYSRRPSIQDVGG